SFDLHANLNPAMAGLLDFATGYRTHPHVDMRETAARALAHLVRIADAKIEPVGAIVNTGVALGSFNMRTADGPMRALQAATRARESPPVLDASVFGGFPYADTPDCGASAMVYAHGSRTAAREAASELAEAIRARAAEFAPALVAPDEGLRRALASPAGLVAGTDPTDNPDSRGAAHTPGLFRPLLAPAPPRPTGVACLFHPHP